MATITSSCAPEAPGRRRWLRRAMAAAGLGPLLGCGLVASQPALAIGAQVEVTVIDRETGAPSPAYRHRGGWYVAGRPGARYAIRVANRSGERVLAVMSVDGVNIVTGQTAAFDQSGYVLSPWQTHDFTGWRKSSHEVAAFVFTALPDSYAARTGRPDEVGVIGVAVFRERVSRPLLPSPEIGGRSAAPAAERQRAEADTAAKATAPAAPVPPERLGTGHGEREHAYAGHTRFERSSTRPVEVVSIRYDSHDNLVLAGVIPPPHWASPSPRPNPFPRSISGFVPDPPPR